eukprot:1633514-Prymnesium_polylepis.1
MPPSLLRSSSSTDPRPMNAYKSALSGSTGSKAANAGRACRCAPACSREHPSAQSDVATGSPDGSRMPCALSCASVLFMSKGITR